MRRPAALLIVFVALSACAGETTVPTGSASPREVPDEAPEPGPDPDAEPGPALDETSVDPAVEPVTPVALPDGMSDDDLPADHDLPADNEARRDLMIEWWESTHDDLASGWTWADFGGSLSFTFNVDLADRAEAAGWCPFLREMTARYFPDEEVGDVSISGWVRNAEGRYEDPGWEEIEC